MTAAELGNSELCSMANWTRTGSASFVMSNSIDALTEAVVS
jgi:hypothetical protein